MASSVPAPEMASNANMSTAAAWERGSGLAVDWQWMESWNPISADR